ncbi:MAG TPA: DUF2752 domain-containing protein [Candidatus Angelobacter sp.]|nr:DUF2752 domain-containing protein [Candidatus Angelobacter sp.]
MPNDSETVRVRAVDWKKIYLIPAAVLCAVAAVIFFLFDPTKVAIFPPCLFHQLTGLDCPGCGAQRALHQLLHGHLIAALRLNAMFVVSLPLGAWYLPRFIKRSVNHPQTSSKVGWLWIYFGAWIAFGVLRNLPFPICAWFAA